MTPNSLSSGAPAAAVSAGVSAANALAAASFVTASSLSGEHLRVVVQVTKDGVAVVYPAFTLPVEGLDVYVGSVTGQQFSALAANTGRTLEVAEAQREKMGLLDWKVALQRSMVTLEALLEVSYLAVACTCAALTLSALLRCSPSPSASIWTFSTPRQPTYEATQACRRSRSTTSSMPSCTPCIGQARRSASRVARFSSPREVLRCARRSTGSSRTVSCLNAVSQ